MKNSIADILAAVSETVKLIIAEIECKPAKRNWPEQAVETWPIEIAQDGNAMERYCRPDLAKKLRDLLDESEANREMFKEDKDRFFELARTVGCRNSNQAPQELIANYFKNLSYPDIVECGPVLYGKTGDVYLVKFQKKKTEVTRGTPPNTPDSIAKSSFLESGFDGNKKRYSETTDVEIPNAYAIIINGAVSGYHENFWEDADKYRLVLKQHLGMLAMESAEKEPVAVPKMEAPAAPPGTVKTETVDAIVTRYEEMIAVLQNEAAERQANDAEKLRALEREVDGMRSRIDNAKKALDGDAVVVPSEQAEQRTPEQHAVASAIRSGETDFLDHGGEAEAVAGYVRPDNHPVWKNGDHDYPVSSNEGTLLARRAGQRAFNTAMNGYPRIITPLSAVPPADIEGR